MLNNNMVPKFIDLNNHKKRILKFVLLWVRKSASLERVSELPRRTCQK